MAGKKYPGFSFLRRPKTGTLPVAKKRVIKSRVESEQVLSPSVPFVEETETIQQTIQTPERTVMVEAKKSFRRVNVNEESPYIFQEMVMFD
ncbi:MAG: hypothetical protein IKA36_06530, partial [Clostridia bacterium]|nr:hypothetical protein [Clostridia bacterium]